MSQTRLVNRDELRDKIKGELAIEDVIRSLGPDLIPAGREWKGTCPFHEDKDPSFYVSPDKGLWTCHSCKRGGDIFTFVEEMEGVSYVEALYRLAELASIDTAIYERPLTAAEAEKDQLRRDLTEYLRVASIRLGKAGGLRGLSPEIIERFHVGLTNGAPFSTIWHSDFGRSELWDEAIVYPICDHTGSLHSLMFKPKSGQPKYIRTATSFPLTDGRPVLYGLDQARRHIVHGRLVLVEGQHDVLALVDAGVENVAGLNGTSLSEKHFDLLRSLRVDEVVLMLDNDVAGRRRTLELARAFAAREPRLFVALVGSEWEDGADPDDMIEAGLLDMLLDSIDNAEDAIGFILRSIWEEEPRETVTSRLAYVRELKIFLQTVSLSQAELSIIAQKVAAMLELPFLEIVDLIQVRGGDFGKLDSVESERIVLGALLRDLGKLVTFDLSDRVFQHSRHRVIYQLLRSAHQAGVRVLDLVAFKQQAEILGLDAALEDTSYIEHLISLDEGNLDFHLGQIIGLHFRRSVFERVQGLNVEVRDLKNDAIQVVSEAMADIIGLTSTRRDMDEFSTLAEATDSTMELLYNRIQGGSPIIGLDLGESYPVINRTLQGLVTGRLSLVLSSQGRGKTALLCNFAHATSIIGGDPSLFVELEMTREELVFRFLALMSGVEHQRIASGAINKEELRKVELGALRLRQSPLHIYAPGYMTKTMLEMVIRRYKLQYGIKAAWIDYVQLVSPDQQEERLNRYGQLGELSRMMKMRLARELDVAICVAAQLNRDASKVQESTSEFVGDSYRLVQDADVVMILREVKGGGIEIWIDKNRSGVRQVLVPMTFHKESQWIVETMHGPASPSWRV